MDYIAAKELSKVAEEQRKHAKKYAEARARAGAAESQLKIMVAANLRDLREEKKNIGVEMAILMLMEDNSTARDLYKEYIEQEAIYKGLEKLIDAYASKLITEQAIMKFVGAGERWG